MEAQQAEQQTENAQPPRATPEPPPIDVEVSTSTLRGMGNLAREVLQDAKLPRHFWFTSSFYDLVVGALGQYQKERKRVLNQRASLRRLHVKVLQLKGELDGLRNKLDRTEHDNEVLYAQLEEARKAARGVKR